MVPRPLASAFVAFVLLASFPVDVEAQRDAADWRSAPPAVGPSESFTLRELELRKSMAVEETPEGLLGLATLRRAGLFRSEFELSIASDGRVYSWNTPWPRERADLRTSGIRALLERGLEKTGSGGELRPALTRELVSVCLLQGDFESVDLWRQRTGQMPLWLRERPNLSCPPQDLADPWRECDPSLRTGTASVIVHVEFEGEGLRGVHFLLRPCEFRNASRRGVSISGWRKDQLTNLVGREGGPWRSGGGDLERTRYACTDETGTARFDSLPAVPLQLDILLPTGNVPTDAQEFRLGYRVGDLVRDLEPVPLQRIDLSIVPKEGEELVLPTLVVRPARAEGR